ncbi:hypothetical protein LV476_04735 [Guyparkeria hydrothermalis]|uniref:hypothetical protein n=1 Tax=Guyparkeria hydrothermalis TaxID=923 RepID=UPI0020200837|nr:hypothetical protein [Guyparkeria hydrothermalis]MCL7744257.1 hypothetical protein [Guyparkeria hydrothermalis]
MMSKLPEDKVRVPVKLVDGRWEFFYGGKVPVSDGATGEIVVDKRHLNDDDFLARLKKKSSHKIMDQGTRLMVALNIKTDPRIGKELSKHLKTIPSGLISIDKRFTRFGVQPHTRFIEITVGAKTPNRQRSRTEEGGIWLEFEGMEPQGVSVSSLILPEGVIDQRIDSLNHAFTVLSETYEPWRQSHTGSVYERIFYEEENGIWNPLNVLRNATIASEEQNMIRKRWKDICAQLNLDI